ncbi:uncharacterized protein CLUP02_13646 [Colletotrichum lupini]|uniref:Uncharacterized protein n=1 Tax=Colletotrichum lupini TaxID=145971 RepID=A0A9Q8T2J6_9PEZI|nr:uncharacterized protein CLUP02_13646 [Colletotrichum lupini]UQC88124.1 hypothetical protein CLUP02_13646 [Colletotrichum lupini]
MGTLGESKKDEIRQGGKKAKRPPPHPHRNTFTHPHTSHTHSLSFSLSLILTLSLSSHYPLHNPHPRSQIPKSSLPSLQHPSTTLPHNHTHTATTEYGYLTFTQPCPPPATLDTHTHTHTHTHTPLLLLSFVAAPLLLILTSSQHCPPLSSLPCHPRRSWVLAPLPPSTPGRIHHRTSVSSGPQQLSDMTLPVCTQPRSCSLPRSPPRLGLPTSTLHASRRDLSSIHNKA